MFDRQLMFDDAAKHMAQQRSKSSDGGLCLYRGPDDKKCIIGAFLPKSAVQYDLMSLGDVIPFIDVKYGTKSDNFEDDLFVANLQKLHDGARDNGNWQDLRRQLFSSFEVFARKYGLNFAVARKVLTREDEVPESERIPAFTVGGKYDSEKYDPAAVQ